MQKIIFLALGILVIIGFYYYQSNSIRSELIQPEPIPEESLTPIDEVVQDMGDEAIQFSLNADSLDQYLSEENPFYSGGFVPTLNALGMLQPASEAVLQQFARFEFLDNDEFRNDRGRSAILEYARGSLVDEAAANLAGFYRGHVLLNGHKGQVWISFVPIGADGLVYDAQWSFASKTVRRFRRIPEQSHWINLYLPVAWVAEQNLRVEIPRGAVLNSGLEQVPTSPGMAPELISGYELRGTVIDGDRLEGEVFAVGITKQLGETVKQTAAIGSFLLKKDDTSSN